jgi:hypothetical protein
MGNSPTQTCPPYVTDPRICEFADTVTGISFAVFFLAPLFLFYYREHPVIAPRIPTLVGAEIMSGMFKVWSIACIYGHWWNVWDPLPCWFAVALYDGIDFPMRMVVTARSVMLVLQNASRSNNTLSKKNPWLYKYLKLVATVTCPEYYNTMIRRIENKIEPIAETKSNRLVAYWRKWRETLLFSSWYLLGMFIVIVDSLDNAGAAETAKKIGDGSFCWIPHLILLGWWQVVWSILNFPILLGVLFYANDKIGYKLEVSFFQTLDIIAALVSADALITRGSSGSLANHLNDKLGLLIPPLISFIFPVVYLLLFRMKQSRRRADSSKVDASETSPNLESGKSSVSPAVSQKFANNVKGFESFWSEGGSELVVEIAEMHYMGEMTAFLKDMDTCMSEGLDFERFKQLYNKYIAEGASFQLNLPGQYFAKWQNAIVMAQKEDADTLHETRKIIVRLLLDNIGRSIRDSIEEMAPKATELETKAS